MNHDLTPSEVAQIHQLMQSDTKRVLDKFQAWRRAEKLEGMLQAARNNDARAVSYAVGQVDEMQDFITDLVSVAGEHKVST